MSNKIKILQVAKHFFPDTGGIETVTQSLSDLLVEHGIQADVLCTSTQPDHVDTEQRYRVIRCKEGVRITGNKSFSPDYLMQIRKLSAQYDCAIVHMPNPVAVVGILAFWRKPVVLLWHADIAVKPVRILSAPLDRLLARRSAAVIGPTPAHLQCSSIATALVRKGVIIPLPVDPKLPLSPSGSDLAKRVQRFLGGRKLILAVGRLVPYKGFDILIEAMSNTSESLAAVIVGSGPLSGELEAQIARLGLQDRVLLVGRVSDDERGDLIDLAYIGCMPSVTKQEMYGVAQVEMLASGKPVVATNPPGSGVPWVNRDGKTGLIVEPGNPSALADALTTLGRDVELRETLSRGAKTEFKTRHDAATISAQYAGLVRSVARREPIPASVQSSWEPSPRSS